MSEQKQSATKEIESQQPQPKIGSVYRNPEVALLGRLEVVQGGGGNNYDGVSTTRSWRYYKG